MSHSIGAASDGPATAPCPEDGLWRAWLDRDISGMDGPTHYTHDRHLEHCRACQQRVASLRANALHTGRVLYHRPPDVSAADLALARQRLDWRRGAARTTFPIPIPAPSPLPGSAAASKEPRSMPSSISATAFRFRAALASIAAALALTFVIGFTPQGQSAASAFLAQFRGEKIQVIPLDANTLQSADRMFQQLGNLGQVQRPSNSSVAAARRDLLEVETLAETSQKAGFPVTEPRVLPAGLDKTPTIRYLPGQEGRFTFDAARARAYFQSIGQPDVQLPPRFDGATLVVNLPPAVLLHYQPSEAATGSASAAGLVVGQAGQLTVGVESPSGVTLQELREFLLGLPGIPAELKTQIRGIQDWQNTLPLPVPVDKVSWEQTRIGGVDGLILNDNSGLGSGALFQRDGRVYGVAGSYKADEIRRVADSL